MDPLSMSGILLGMQAAGMVFDWFGNQKQKGIGRAGLRLEQAGINANISMTRLQAEDASLQAMQNLRKNLGSQAAYFAATGARGNPAFAQQSISATGQDEKIRRINLIGKEAELRAQNAMAGMQNESFNSNLNNQFIGKLFNMIPGPTAFSGLTGGRANSAKSNFSQPSVARNFGMTPYRG